MDGGPSRGKVWWLPQWVSLSVPAGNQQGRGLQRLLQLRDLEPQGFKQEDSLRPRLASHSKDLRHRACLLYFLHGCKPTHLHLRACTATLNIPALPSLIRPPPASLLPRPTDRAQMSLSIPFGPWGESVHQLPTPSGWASPDHGESPSCRHSQAIPHTVAHLSVESTRASTTPRSLGLHCTATGLAHLGLLGAETRQQTACSQGSLHEPMACRPLSGVSLHTPETPFVDLLL